MLIQVVMLAKVLSQGHKLHSALRKDRLLGSMVIAFSVGTPHPATWEGEETAFTTETTATWESRATPVAISWPGTGSTGIGGILTRGISLCRETQLLQSTTHCWGYCWPWSSWPSVDLDVKTCFKNPTNKVFVLFPISNCPVPTNQMSFLVWIITGAYRPLSQCCQSDQLIAWRQMPPSHWE